MGEDYIRREDFLEFLETFFDRRTEIGQESISKRFHNNRFAPYAAQERVGAASGFHGPFRVST
jgi:hypothetical protein